MPGEEEQIDPQEALFGAYDALQAETDAAKKTELEANFKKAFEAGRGALKTRKEQEAANRPPDAYELETPKDTLLKPERLEDLKAFAKANKLSLTQAKLFLEREHTAVDGFFKSQQAEVQKTQEAWAAENLKNFGGDEKKLAAASENANRLLKKYDPEGKLSAELKTSGLGNHPGLLSFLNDVAATMSEDQLVTGTGGGSTKSKSFLSKSLTDAGVKQD